MSGGAKVGQDGGQQKKTHEAAENDISSQTQDMGTKTLFPRTLTPFGARRNEGTSGVNYNRIKKKKTTISRPLTIAIIPARKDTDFNEQDVFNYMKQHSEENKIRAIQKIGSSYEITFKTTQYREEFQNKNKLQIIGNINYNIKKPREATYMEKENLIEVYVYNYPEEESDKHLKKKMEKYGDVAQIQRIARKGTNIHTGTRCVNFSKLTEQIPTTVFCRRMMIKTRYKGQDRTAICSKCKARGHHQTECKKKEEDEKKKNEEQETRLKEIMKQEEEIIQKKKAEDRRLIISKKAEERRIIKPKKAEERRQNMYKKREAEEQNNPAKRRKEDEEEYMKTRLRKSNGGNMYPNFEEWQRNQIEQVVSYFKKEQLWQMYVEAYEVWRKEQTEQPPKKNPD